MFYLCYEEMDNFKIILIWFCIYIEKKKCLFFDRIFIEKEENYY